MRQQATPNQKEIVMILHNGLQDGTKRRMIYDLLSDETRAAVKWWNIGTPGETSRQGERQSMNFSIQASAVADVLGRSQA